MGELITAVFSNGADARGPKDALQACGVSASGIVSTDLTADGIAAEAPGQAYGRQTGNPVYGGSADAHFMAVLQAGAVALTVGPISEAPVAERVKRMLEQSGAAVFSRFEE